MKARLVTKKKKKPNGLPNDIRKAPHKPNDEPINSASIFMSKEIL